MIRLILLNLFLLFLPVLLYFLYVYTLRRLRGTSGPVDTSPILWLFFVGIVLMVGSLVYLVEFTRQGATDYSPPVFRDGVVVPGRVK